TRSLRTLRPPHRLPARTPVPPPPPRTSRAPRTRAPWPPTRPWPPCAPSSPATDLRIIPGPRPGPRTARGSGRARCSAGRGCGGVLRWGSAPGTDDSPPDPPRRHTSAMTTALDDQPIHSWLTDMDGVLVHEEEALPGAADFIDALQRFGRPFLVLTNNSIFTPRDLRA